MNGPLDGREIIWLRILRFDGEAWVNGMRMIEEWTRTVRV